MTSRPILFSGPLVRAILDGTKTQTRRPLTSDTNLTCKELGQTCRCRYGVSGDQLWVRETFALSIADPDTAEPDTKNKWHWDPPIYRADGEAQGGGWTGENGEPIKPPWRPSIHMPRWASRITLDVMSVRVERLQDITEEDAIAEGVQYADRDPCHPPWHIGDHNYCETAREAFAEAWNGIYSGASSWESNPWTWVISFARNSRAPIGNAGTR